MAGEDRSHDDRLIRELERHPRRFSFFQAVRLLERAAAGAEPLGGDGPPSAEAVRLRSSASLAFQASDVTRLERREDAEGGPRWHLTTTVMGLVGASSPLPAFYSEDVLQYETRFAPAEDPARRLLDVPGHRFLSHLYRSWARCRWALAYRPGARDETSRRMLALLGLGAGPRGARPAVPPARLLRYAGLLGRRVRGAGVLSAALSDWFGRVPVRVEQCVPQRVEVPEPDRLRLGRQACTLGADAVLGASVADRAGRFRVVVGPLGSRRDYERFLPGSPRARELDALVGLFVPDPPDWDVEVRLRGPAVPRTQLTGDGGASRLGWTTWLSAEGGGPDRAVRFPRPAHAA